jgi:DNA-binding transcriptional LysR family regulator
VAFESRSTSLRQRIVSASDLLNFTSRSAIREAGPGSGVKALAIGELTWKRPIGVIYRHETYLPPAVQRFVQILKETAKKLQK